MVGVLGPGFAVGGEGISNAFIRRVVLATAGAVVPAGAGVPEVETGIITEHGAVDIVAAVPGGR